MVLFIKQQNHTNQGKEMITLKTLSQATEQEVFDQVARHLLTQRKQSILIQINSRGESVEKCQYRSKVTIPIDGAYGTFNIEPDSLSCAAGCLISNEEYSPSMEFRQWNSLVKANVVPSEHSDLIIRLQQIHDIYEFDDWITELTKCAKNRNLSTEVLNEFRAN